MKRRIFALSGIALVVAAASGYWRWQKRKKDWHYDLPQNELLEQVAQLPLIQPTLLKKRLLGLNVNWIEQSRLRRDLTKVSTLLHQLGGNVTRDSHEWAWVQQKINGPYVRDRFVTTAEDHIRNTYKNNEIESLRLLCYGNNAYWRGETMPTTAVFSQFIKGFIAYTLHIMEDQPNTRLFEVWNEWNLTAHFKGNEEIRRGSLYAQLFVHAAAAIHKKSPDAMAITQGLAISKEANGLPDNEFLVRTLNHPGVLQSADGIGLHPYFFKINGSPERLMNYLVFTRQQLLREVKGYSERTLPFFITETGFPTAEKSNFSIGSSWGYGIDETLQAAFLTRLAILCFSQSYVQGLVFHNFIDSGDNKEDIEHNFGLLHNDLTPKLAWRRLAVLIPVLIQASEFEWIIGQTAEVAGSVKEAFDASISPIYAVRFRCGSNRWCTAVWATTSKSSTARVMLPQGANSLEVCEKQFNLEPNTFSNNASGHISIKLGLEPVYITQMQETKPEALQIMI